VSPRDGVRSLSNPSHILRAVTLRKPPKSWTANAKIYLASVPKSRILRVMREAAPPEDADALKGFKKADLVKSAEERLAGTGWLPAILRLNRK
jgi:ParB family chromosome partitioning protein